MSNSLPLSALAAMSAAIVLAGAGAAPAQGPNDWPTYQGNARHDGRMPVVLNPTSLGFAWETVVGSDTLSPAAAADGYVVVTQEFGVDRGTYGLDAATGQLLWSQNPATGYNVGQAALQDGRAYVQVDESGDLWLRSYDVTDGTLLFDQWFDSQNVSFYAPVVQDGVVYMCSGRTNGMAAHDALTGTEIWYQDMELGDEWSPAILDGICYGYASGYLDAIDQQTGALLWRVQDFDAETVGVVGETAVIGDDDDLLVINGGRLVSFARQDGALRWSVPGSFSGDPCVADGLIYAINAGVLEVREDADGSLVDDWTPPAGSLDRNLILTPGHLVASSASDTWVLDRASLTQQWTYAAGGWLSLGDGLLLIAQDSGTLTALAFDELPQPLSVTPDRADYFASAGVTVTVRGFAFDEPGATSVGFGGLPASQVTVLDEETLEAVLPAGEPGFVDLTVSDGTGSATLAEGFVFSPAQRVSGDYVLGGAVDLALRFEPGKSVAGLYDFGAARATPLTVPPLIGDFWLQQYSILFEAPSWPFDDDLVLRFTIPNDPSLQGQMVQIQSVVGDDPRGRIGAFTNLQSFTIQ